MTEPTSHAEFSPDPLSIAPRLRDTAVGFGALLTADALLIGSAFGLKGIGLGGAVKVVLPVLIVLSLVIPTIALVVYLKRRGIPLGFRPLGKRGWHLLWQVPVSIFAAALCTSLIAPLLGVEQDGPSSAASESGALILFTLSAYLLIGPFLEELVFRRLFMGYLDTLMPAAASVLLSSLVFGLVHLSPPAIVYTFFGGLTMALVTRWHHSLWAGFILHMLNNLLVNVIVLTGL